MKKIIFSLYMFLLVSTIFSEVTLSTIEDIIEYTITNSLEIRETLLSLDEAEDRLETLFKIDETAISSSLRYDGEGYITFDSLVNIPLTDQFSINGTVDNSMGGSIGLSLKPFNFSKDVEIAANVYQMELLNSDTSNTNITNSVIEAALNWMSAFRMFKLEEKKEYMYKSIYEDNKDRYKIGSITLDQLQESLITWSDSRKELLSQKQTFYSVESTLYSKLGSIKESVDIEHFDIPTLKSSVERLKEMIFSMEGSFLNDSSLRNSNLELERKKLDYESIWSYEPDLNANMNLGFDDSGFNMSNFSVSLTFSLDLGDFNSDEKARLEERYILTQKELELQYAESKKEFELSLNTIETSSIEREIALYEYEQANILLSEAEILFRVGEFSKMDLLNSQIFLQQAENGLFNALKSEYIILLNYLKYF